MSRLYITAVLVTGVCVVGVTVFNHSTLPVKRAMPAAKQGSIFASGFVEGAEKRSHLRVQASGRIAAVHVNVGQVVEKGDVLVELDGRAQKQDVQRAEARVALAQARLSRLTNGAHDEERREAESQLLSRKIRYKQALRKRDRLLSLSTQQAISQQDLDDQETLVSALKTEVDAAQARFNLLESPTREDDLEIARAERDIAVADLELARIAVSHTQLRAPIAGKVLDIAARVGEMTGPQAAQAVIVMADTSRVFVRAFVEELDAFRVELGNQATITADWLPETLRGSVASLSPQMQRKWFVTGAASERHDTQVREVLIELASPIDLVVGQRVDVQIGPDELHP